MQTADNFIPVIPIGYREHTDHRPFCWDDRCPCREDQEAIAQVACWDDRCPCREDQEAIAQVAQWVQDGLMTPQQATDFVKGKGI